MDILEYSSGQYQQAFTRILIQQTMQIQELSRLSKVFTKPWIFLELLESLLKSLLKDRMVEIILGKCDFRKYIIFF